jgi:predicted pyridoxine 5'-phosphate oxidase superfamily flavin-nucleotide-binding protein
MTATYFQTMFGDAARALQERAGSRSAYARAEAGGGGDALTEREISFLEARDSFYMASVTEDGWPYVQHRGGPAGFVKVIGPRRISFADYPGNRQYISVGNLATDDRVSLFFMDYVARRRLKLIGHAHVADVDAALTEAHEPAERVIVVNIVGYDWNCPQHITQRFPAPEIAPVLEGLREENARLRAELARLKGGME